MSTLIDSYSESNKNTQTKISIADGITKEGTSFSVSATNEFLLDNVVFYLIKGATDGSFPPLATTGNVYAEIYEITGTPGTDSLPTGSVLATSNPLDVSTLSTTVFALKSFTFSGLNRIILLGSHNYFVGLRYEGVGGVHRGLIIGVDNTKGNVSQNAAYYNYGTSAWVTSPSSFDICFYVYGDSTVLDSFSESNQNGNTLLFHGSDIFDGQSFTTPNDSNSYVLDSCKFNLFNYSASGNIYAKLYSHTGTYGSTGIPDTLLATSDAIDVSSISSYPTFGLVKFVFSGADRIVLSSNTHYVIQCNYDGADAGQKIGVGFSSIGGASGNRSFSTNGSFWSSSTGDVCFYVYSLTTNYPMVIAPASFAYTPQTSGDPVIRNLPTAPATFVLTGMASGFKRIMTMVTASATFILTGMSVNMSIRRLIRPVINLINIIKPKFKGIIYAIKPKLK